MSCRFQPLYNGDLGYVVRCVHCNYYQIAFGSFLLTLKSTDFDRFYKYIRKVTAQTCHQRNVYAGSMAIPTPAQEVHLVLNSIELSKLSAMLDKADSELKTQTLLELFK